MDVSIKADLVGPHENPISVSSAEVDGLCADSDRERERRADVGLGVSCAEESSIED